MKPLGLNFSTRIVHGNPDGIVPMKLRRILYVYSDRVERAWTCDSQLKDPACFWLRLIGTRRSAGVNGRAHNGSNNGYRNNDRASDTKTSQSQSHASTSSHKTLLECSESGDNIQAETIYPLR